MIQSSTAARLTAVRSIKKSSDFKKVYEYGRYDINRYFVVYVMPNGLGHMRLGLSIKKKVGVAVLRNRLRRLVKENFRINQSRELAVDVVVVVRNPAVELAVGDGFWLVKKYLNVPRDLA